MSEKATDQPMTATERNTLIRITKQRFKLLHQGIHARTEQLRRQIQAEVMEEHAAAMKAAEARVEKVIAKLEKAWNEYVAIMEDEYEKNGLKGRSGMGLSGRPVRSFSDGPGSYVERKFTPADLSQEVSERLVKITGDKPVSQYALEVEEARILEAILVGNLKTGESQRFLDSIPTLESLIPLTNGNGAQQAIEA